METLNPDFPVIYRPFEQWRSDRFVFDLHSAYASYDYLVVVKDIDPGIVWHREVHAFDTLSDLYDWLEDEKHAIYVGKGR